MPDPKRERPRPDLPPVDPEALQRAARRFLNVKKPPGGWPGKPPREAQTDEGDDD